ncbi:MULTISPECIES: DUF2238 domain-containing protein [unclassified Sphingobium]|uniref:DUF2238 domain-containing protein n=1 Tax=unclassified Sphingobium TaxID=2611147 RepID=UPI0022256B74|nr:MULTISPECIES: DUF2238 domain-containing protein [unclassified Sphingobium]MCW2350298.1 putative membrane protein [Sphingobium sp. B12D2B]MCW2369402.1 putative membrane protein [Sphingobium sp. B11D3D]
MGRARAREALPALQWGLLGSLLSAIGLANIDQPFPALAPLQHAPTVLLVIVAPWLLRRWPLTVRSVGLIWLFLLLHTVGGRYIYSYVPYGGWIAGVTGDAAAALLGSARNGYDRFIHLMFGLLLTPVFAEIGQRHGALRRGTAWLLAFALVGLASALYEVFEWLLTLMLAGDTADYYNGQQGDMWDPQKDMALAQIGSGFACLISRAAIGRWSPLTR